MRVSREAQRKRVKPTGVFVGGREAAGGPGPGWARRPVDRAGAGAAPGVPETPGGCKAQLRISVRFYCYPFHSCMKFMQNRCKFLPRAAATCIWHCFSTGREGWLAIQSVVS
jgi:hypothetical protein